MQVAYKDRRLGAAVLDRQATDGLCRVRRLRARYAAGDLTGAVVSAAYYAKKTGETMFVYEGNSYMHRAYRVSSKASEFLCPVGSPGAAVLSVTPDREVRRHDVV